MGHYPRDGICKGQDGDSDQSITSLEQVQGDWWVVRGLNCGFGDYPGGYDGEFPGEKTKWQATTSS